MWVLTRKFKIPNNPKYRVCNKENNFPNVYNHTLWNKPNNTATIQSTRDQILVLQLSGLPHGHVDWHDFTARRPWLVSLTSARLHADHASRLPRHDVHFHDVRNVPRRCSRRLGTVSPSTRDNSRTGFTDKPATTMTLARLVLTPDPRLLTGITDEIELSLQLFAVFHEYNLCIQLVNFHAKFKSTCSPAQHGQYVSVHTDSSLNCVVRSLDGQTVAASQQWVRRGTWINPPYCSALLSRRFAVRHVRPDKPWPSQIHCRWLTTRTWLTSNTRLKITTLHRNWRRWQ